MDSDHSDRRHSHRNFKHRTDDHHCSNDNNSAHDYHHYYPSDEHYDDIIWVEFCDHNEHNRDYVFIRIQSVVDRPRELDSNDDFDIHSDYCNDELDFYFLYLPSNHRMRVTECIRNRNDIRRLNRSLYYLFGRDTELLQLGPCRHLELLGYPAAEEVTDAPRPKDFDSISPSKVCNFGRQPPLQ